MRIRRLAVLIGAAVVAIWIPAGHACAQDAAEHDASRFGLFGGASVLLWSTPGTREDPAGSGYFHPHFHGSLEWPAVGAAVDAGVFVHRHWSVGGELAIRRVQSAPIREEVYDRSTSYALYPLYTQRERLVSVVARWHPGSKSRVAVEPFGGLTVSHSTQALTNRQGLSSSYSCSRCYPVKLPDVETEATRFGVVGGTDVTFRLRGGISITGGARLHSIARHEVPIEIHDMPTQGPFVFQITTGFRWQSRRP